jgi:glutathione synthase/RimK-type ligase-like ATP-grasp enzyme|uniref:ATP-grasp fold RimK-type domain-containing protein n=1 Tax=Desulfobacca acetoxidans TaxID=60893 RepID=A0A7V6A2W4_9BACT
MARKPCVVRSLTELRRSSEELLAGDLVLGPLAVKPGEEIILLDLHERGVGFFPPLLAQAVVRTKSAQARILSGYMLPGTFVAHDLADLAAHLGDARLWGAVVSKRDRAHLGLGVSLWPSLEALHSLAVVQPCPFPLVVQPFLAEARDLRVVVVGDYTEAYERLNPKGFRKNLFQGGTFAPVEAGPELLSFCRRAMARGKFPYAVLDVLISPQGEMFLSEINFNAGLKGSQLGQAEYRRRVEALLEDFQHQWESSLMTRS